ncbi:MAG: winged helix-turn-helix domain-containing protein [Eisenbergiella sp.]
MEKLYENAGRIVTTGSLCETVCGNSGRAMKPLSTHIRHLREKIEQNPQNLFPCAVKGLGYRLYLKGVKR